jgi:hypothetical protein
VQTVRKGDFPHKEECLLLVRLWENCDTAQVFLADEIQEEQAETVNLSPGR